MWRPLAIVLGAVLYAGTTCCDEAPPLPDVAVPDEVSADPDIAADWEQLTGRWERQQALPDGTSLRLVKSITDHHEILRVYSPDGQLIREQQADLVLERRGNLRVLGWSHAHVTAGLGVGTSIADGTAVINFRGGQYICVCGLAADEDWSVYTETWDRPPAETPIN
jgi:hypothetical protein